MRNGLGNTQPELRADTQADVFRRAFRDEDFPIEYGNIPGEIDGPLRIRTH